MVQVPDLKAQMARIKELKEGKVGSVSSYQLAKEEKQDKTDSERLGVDLTKFCKTHQLGDLENKVFLRSSLIQEQIDIIMKHLDDSEKYRDYATRQIDEKINNLFAPMQNDL